MNERIAAAMERFSRAQESLVIQQSDFSLATITQMVDNEAIDLDPHYQRRERWNPVKQSALIESFVLNVPVPPVYLAEEEYGNYSVIDGKQRITSVSKFLRGEFKLRKLERFPELNGMYFDDLPINIKNALNIRPYIRVVTLLKQSDPSLKYEVFIRLNTGGEKLKAQEIRNVAYSGRLNDLLFELSENNLLRRRMKIENGKESRSTAWSNMDDLEHILRFFALEANWENVNSILSYEMNDFMRENRNLAENKLNELRTKFEIAINRCEGLWPDTYFQKPYGNTWREQLISPLYDAEMVSVSMLTQEQYDALINLNIDKSSIVRNLFETNDAFVKSVTSATNNRSNVYRRIGMLHNELLNHLN